MSAQRVMRCGVAIMALHASTVLAQTTQARAQASGETAQTSGVGDIIVTAQRRSERAQDVPIVITAFSSDKLRQLNVTQPQDLYGNVPSLVSGTQGQASRDVQSYSIRGQSTGYLASPGVAVYIAEVPLPSSITLNLQGAPGQFLDLENVQVLSGPQGTLFGRNTTGGAVLLVPHKPTNDFGGYLEGSVGSYDLRSAEGALNVPIIDDTLMVRVAGAYEDRRGYTKDLVWDKWRDDIHYYTGRIGILFKPSEKFDNYILAYGTRSSNNGSGNINEDFNIPALQAIGFCKEGAAVPGVIASCDVYRRQTQIQQEIGPRRMRGNVDAFSRIRSWGVIDTSSYHFTPNLTLRNIFSFQKLKDNYATDQDGTPLEQYESNQNARQPSSPITGLSDEFGLPLTGSYMNAEPDFNLPRDYLKQITEELQLQGTLIDNHLNFAVGGFYYDAKPAGPWGSRAMDYCPAEFTGLCTFQPGEAGVSNRSKALYGQATLDLGAVSSALEKLRLTTGYRYTWDRIEGFDIAYTPSADGTTASCLVDGTTPGVVPIADIDSCAFSARLKSKAPTWTFGVDYRLMKNLLVYAKVSRGYKAGGFNTAAVRVETQTFQPEKLTTYEAGFKSDWRLANMPFQFNATYYYSKYSNIQRPGGDTNPATGVAGAAVYAAKATIQGIELEGTIRPAHGIELGGTLSYTDAKYDRFDVPIFAPTVDCNGPISPGAPGAPQVFADDSCARFEYVTPWIYNLHASIDVPLPDGLGGLTLYATYNHVSSQYTAPALDVSNATLKGYGLVNASLAWHGIGGTRLDATLFVTNLTNKLYRVSNSNTYDTLLVDSTLYGEPRMFGLKVRYTFGR
jgi:iron complex outermembrane recepter protein